MKYCHCRFSYPESTMVLVLSADNMYFYWFKCWSENGTHVSSEPAAIRRISTHDKAIMCRWAGYVATCRTVLNPTKFGLSGLNGSGFVTVRSLDKLMSSTGSTAFRCHFERP